MDTNKHPPAKPWRSGNMEGIPLWFFPFKFIVMEKIKQYNLFRNIVGGVVFASLAFAKVASAEQTETDPYLPFNKSDFIGISNMIPFFFEGCEVQLRGWIGRGSVYTEAGCIGCRGDLLMANGERLSDNKPTFAAWRDDLNTYYALKNTENGLRAKGKLTDRGGFDRLANPNPQTITIQELEERTFDLSLSLSARLGHIQTSKKTLVDFNKLNCG